MSTQFPKTPKIRFVDQPPPKARAKSTAYADERDTMKRHPAQWIVLKTCERDSQAASLTQAIKRGKGVWQVEDGANGEWEAVSRGTDVYTRWMEF